MRLDLRGNRVHVVLSRRNVLSLLRKLEMPGSARTLAVLEGEPAQRLIHGPRPETPEDAEQE